MNAMLVCDRVGASIEATLEWEEAAGGGLEEMCLKAASMLRGERGGGGGRGQEGVVVGRSVGEGGGALRQPGESAS